MTFGERIRACREALGITQEELATKMGYKSRSSINKIELDERNMKQSQIVKLAEALETTPAYLMGWEDEKKNPLPDRPAPIIAPILGRIPAGYPLEGIEDRTGEEELSPLQYDRSKKYFCLTIHGDSMYPKYLEGDTVVFEWCQDCENGAECAVSVNGFDATFKKVIKQKNCIVLQPLNPKYDPIVIDPNDPETPVTIYGVAREIRRSV